VRPRLGAGWLAALLAVSVPCSAAPPQTKPYRITGVVISTRDGSPVARCRITADATSTNQMGAGRTVGQRPGPGSGGGGRSGPQGGMRGGGMPTPPPEAITDGSGKFTLELPHAGGWRLNASAHGFRTQNYDEHDDFFSAVVLTDAAPAFNLTFRLAPDAVLTGLIYDEAGEPVASALVVAEEIPPAVPGGSIVAQRPRQAGAGQTDDRGRYEIGGLAPASYRLRVQAQPWYAQNQAFLQRNVNAAANAAPSPDPSLDMVYPTTFFPGTDDETAAEELKLLAGEEREADFHLTPIPSVHLRIPRAATPEQANSAQNGDRRQLQPQQRPATITRLSGEGFNSMQQFGPMGMGGTEWDFGGLTPGTYEVRLPGSDPRGLDGEVQQIEIRPGGQTVVTLEQARATVKVAVATDGETNAQVLFGDVKTGAITTMEMGNPRGGFRRGGDEEPDGPREEMRPKTRTVNLAPGTYEVTVVGVGTGAYLTGITAAGAKAVGRTVTITGTGTLTLHLATKRAKVEGVVQLEGKAAQGAIVLLVPATLGEPGDLHSIERDETNTDGTFEITGVVPGQYILVAIDRGWDVNWRNPATLAQYLVYGMPVDLTRAAKVQQEVEAVEP
jgi:hypothetical protein